MKKKLTLYVMTLVLLVGLIFGAGTAVFAESNAEEVELAIVDTAEVVEEDEDIIYSEIQSVADELGYDMTVDVQSLDWHLKDEVEGVASFGGEDVTDQVDEVVGDSEDIEEAEEASGVEDITDEIIDNL